MAHTRYPGGFTVKRRSALLMILIAYASFVGLGVLAGLLGVAWPSIRDTFGLRLDSIGVLFTATTAGSLIAAFASGTVVGRVGSGRFLFFSTVLAVVGLAGYALAPAWWVMVGCGLLTGAAEGAIDAGLNAYFAANHNARLMNWLHAAFGLGATGGPVLMTALLTAGKSWRWGFVTVGVAQVLVALGMVLTLDRWQPTVPESSSRARETPLARPEPATATLMLPLVWLSVVLFFFVAGTETSAGQWAYSLFTEGRGVNTATAGLWVSVYWVAIAGGRIVYGMTGDRLGLNRLLRISMLIMIAGAVLLWWNPSNLLSFVGLALIGFGLAPVFPLLQLVTPTRVGQTHAANAIGFQTAVAYLGLGFLPGLAGVLAERWGLALVGPFLVCCSVAMFVLHEIVVRRAGEAV